MLYWSRGCSKQQKQKQGQACVLIVGPSLDLMRISIALQQGNRSSSSACGSADVLEALGINIDLGPEVVCGYHNINILL